MGMAFLCRIGQAVRHGEFPMLNVFLLKEGIRCRIIISETVRQKGIAQTAAF